MELRKARKISGIIGGVNQGRSLEETAQREGFPVWRVGQIVALKGMGWRVEAIFPDSKSLLLKYQSKIKGIAAMWERLNKIKRKLKCPPN